MDDRTKAAKNDHEDIEWFPISSLPENVIPNLHFLIPLAREVLRGHAIKDVAIRY